MLPIGHTEAFVKQQCIADVVIAIVHKDRPVNVNNNYRNNDQLIIHTPSLTVIKDLSKKDQICHIVR